MCAMHAAWAHDDPVKVAVLALFSGEPLLGTTGKLPFLAGCIPPKLPPLATQDVPSPRVKVFARFHSLCKSAVVAASLRHV